MDKLTDYVYAYLNNNSESVQSRHVYNSLRDMYGLERFSDQFVKYKKKCEVKTVDPNGEKVDKFSKVFVGLNKKNVRNIDLTYKELKLAFDNSYSFWLEKNETVVRPDACMLYRYENDNADVKKARKVFFEAMKDTKVPTNTIVMFALSQYFGQLVTNWLQVGLILFGNHKKNVPSTLKKRPNQSQSSEPTKKIKPTPRRGNIDRVDYEFYRVLERNIIQHEKYIDNSGKTQWNEKIVRTKIGDNIYRFINKKRDVQHTVDKDDVVCTCEHFKFAGLRFLDKKDDKLKCKHLKYLATHPQVFQDMENYTQDLIDTEHQDLMNEDITSDGEEI